MEIYVLDTSAILTYLEDEDGADFVEHLLIKAENREIFIYIAFITLTEVFYITLYEKNEIEAQRRIDLIKALEIQIIESDEIFNISAGKLKARYRISLADAYIAALCENCRGILVHKDPEYESLSVLIKEYRLPYK